MATRRTSDGTDVPVRMVDGDRVRMRAYEIYLSRGAGDGDALSDWLQAEREVSEEEVPVVMTPAVRGSVSGARNPRMRSRALCQPVNADWELEPLEAVIDRQRRGRCVQVIPH